MKVYLSTDSYNLPHVGHFLPQIAHAQTQMLQAGELAVVFFSASYEGHILKKYGEEEKKAEKDRDVAKQSIIKARRARVLSAKKRNRMLYKLIVAHKPDNVVVVHRKSETDQKIKLYIEGLQKQNSGKIIVVVDDTLEAIHDYLKEHHQVCEELAQSLGTQKNEITYLAGGDVTNRLDCCRQEHSSHSVTTIARPDNGEELFRGMSSTALDKYLFEPAVAGEEKKDDFSEEKRVHIEATYSLVLPKKYLRQMSKERQGTFQAVYQHICANNRAKDSYVPPRVVQEALRICAAINMSREQVLDRLETLDVSAADKERISDFDQKYQKKVFEKTDEQTKLSIQARINKYYFFGSGNQNREHGTREAKYNQSTNRYNLFSLGTFTGLCGDQLKRQILERFQFCIQRHATSLNELATLKKTLEATKEFAILKKPQGWFTEKSRGFIKTSSQDAFEKLCAEREKELLQQSGQWRAWENTGSHC